jgi:hypothetical protein
MQTLGLWRVCIAYGIDTDSFAAFFPQLFLLHPAFTGQFASRSYCMTTYVQRQCVALFGVLEALCHCRLTAPASPAASSPATMVESTAAPDVDMVRHRCC